MEKSFAPRAFATLGHPDRLAVFRLLMRLAPQGARPTELAALLDLRPNTLSHHLADLTAAGLIQVERQGRSLRYSVNLTATETLIGYLAIDLGRGRPDLLATLPRPPAPAPDRPWRVLFLCSGNSARSLMAEALLRDLGEGRFAAFSAGIRPAAAANPIAQEVLARNGHDIAALHPKPLDSFQTPDCPAMDFVFTLCDSAAAEDCAPWPGQPITGHWGLPDPARAPGTRAERALAFAQTYGALRRRIAAFAALPVASLDRLALQSRVDAIGAPPATEG